MRYLHLVAGLTASAVFALTVGAAEAKTLKAVASFTVLADVVKEVGGAHVEVESLVPPNGDPHEFEPTPTNAKDLKQADIVFVSGEGLEGWLDRLIEASGYPGKPAVASDGIKTRTMDEDGKTITDPHVWNSAANVLVWIANVEKALAAADPEDAGAFKANAARFAKEIAGLDDYAKTAIGAVPAEKRKVLTSHDAFGYFGREYGIAFLSPLGISTDAEPSAAGVAKLINQIKAEKVKVYFFENSNDPRLVKQIANATGAEPGGELYVEALSPPDGPASTYARMFKYNVDQIVAAIRK